MVSKAVFKLSDHFPCIRFPCKKLDSIEPPHTFFQFLFISLSDPGQNRREQGGGQQAGDCSEGPKVRTKRCESYSRIH